MWIVIFDSRVRIEEGAVDRELSNKWREEEKKMHWRAKIPVWRVINERGREGEGERREKMMFGLDRRARCRSRQRQLVCPPHPSLSPLFSSSFLSIPHLLNALLSFTQLTFTFLPHLHFSPFSFFFFFYCFYLFLFLKPHKSSQRLSHYFGRC